MHKLLARDENMEGERLDRFVLIAELASGGMATVFLARLSGVAGFQRLVAIKRLHPHLAKEPEFVEMFLDEARLAARIHHPNVVPIQEVGESPEGYYLVMDYVEGDTLARLLARAASTKTEVPHGVIIRILLDVLAGLHAAHELKDDLGDPLHIVHRDVSPQNILVGVDGIARVVDFGVARAASRLSTTRSGQLKGKLAYMAPEQARGGDIDRRADLFSCGIVLWEALALKRLFKGEGEAETLNRVLYDPIAPPSSVRDNVPKLLEDVCMTALERDVEKRFKTAQDFADALEEAAKDLSCIGSVRDVAQCIDKIVGTELTEQREAVRSWLAKSEPSGGPRSRASLDSVTRIEGKEGSGSKSRRSLAPLSKTGSSLGGVASKVPPAPTSSSGRDFDRFAPTAPAPQGEVVDRGPTPSGAPSHSGVSSVSTVSSAQPEAHSKNRTPLIAAVTVIAVTLIVVVGMRFGHGPESPATPAAPAAPPAPLVTAVQPVMQPMLAVPLDIPPAGASGAPGTGATTASAVPSTTPGAAPSAAPGASAATTKPARPAGRPVGAGAGAGNAAAKPASSTKPSPGVPDDLQNPYR